MDEETKNKIRALQNKAWGAFTDSPEKCIEAVRQAADLLPCAALYIPEGGAYGINKRFAVLYLGNGEGLSFAFPAYPSWKDEKKYNSPIIEADKYANKEEATRHAAWKFKETQEKILEIEYMKNQYGEDIIKREIKEVKAQTPLGKEIILRKTIELNCYSSLVLGLGNCACANHPIYLEDISIKE